MQKKLDDYIEGHHELKGEDLFEKRFLALLVELGELANETRCFKFWSTKEKSADDIIVEEYVDNIHFLLSIGLHKGYTFSEIGVPASVHTDLTAAFNAVFSACLMFYKEQTETHYHIMFQRYLHVANLLGFTEQDIIEAYGKKNEVNYKRQAQGY